MTFKPLDFAISQRFGPVLIVHVIPGGTYVVVWWGIDKPDGPNPPVIPSVGYHHEIVTEGSLIPNRIPEDLQLLRTILEQGAKAWTQAPQPSPIAQGTGP